MEDLKRFYTYAYLRKNRTPYYIGKGNGNRIYKKHKWEIKPPEDASRIIFLKQNLTEEDAFKHEKYMISVFGRKDLGTGILHNRTNGGDGGAGLIHTEEAKIKIREAKKNQSAETRRKIGEANKRRIVSDETRRKMSEANRGKIISQETIEKIKEAKKGQKWWNDGKGNSTLSVECPGENWVAGRTEEHNKNIRDSKIGKPLTEEHKRKLSEANLGRTFSEETRRKLSDANKRRIWTEDTKRKMSESKKGLKWWNDGNGNSKRSLDCPGEGWVLGRSERRK